MSLQPPHLIQHKNKEAKDGTDLKKQADHLTAQNLCISKSYMTCQTMCGSESTWTVFIKKPKKNHFSNSNSGNNGVV